MPPVGDLEQALLLVGRAGERALALVAEELALQQVSPDGKTVEVYIEEATAHLFAHLTNIAFDGAALYTANLGRWHITKIDTDTTGTPLWQRVAEATPA